MAHRQQAQPSATEITKYQRVVIGSIALISLGCAIAVFVPAGLSWDFGNFYDAGHIVVSGEFDKLLKQYRTLIGGELPQGKMQFWGTPLSAYLYAPLAWFSPTTALILFKIGNVLAYYAALLILFHHLNRYVEKDLVAQWRFAAIYTVFALLYQPFWTVFRVGGQSTAFALLLLSLSMYSHSRLKFGWSSFLFVIASMIKPALITGLLFLMFVSPRRFLKFVTIHLFLFGALSVLLMGWDLQFEFLEKMVRGMTWERPWHYNSSIYVLPNAIETMLTARGSGAVTPAFFGALTVFLKILVTTTLFAYFYLNKKYLPSDGARAHLGFLLAVLFFSLITHTLWAHYLSFLFILFAFLLAGYPDLSRSARYLILGAIICLPMQNLIFVNMMHYWFSFDALTSVVPAVMAKTAPLWIMWILVFLCRNDVVEIYTRASKRSATQSLL